MSGSEAVVESFYSVMNSQKKAGGQLNDTLVQRTNIDCCFPFPMQCRETISCCLFSLMNVDVPFQSTAKEAK